MHGHIAHGDAARHHMRGRSVLDDLGNGAHRAFLDAIAAGNACVLVHVLGNAVDDLKNVLRAGVYADSATNALVSFNDRM